MAISVGDTLPNATFLIIGDDGPVAVDLGEKLKDRKVVIFAVPGAFTPTCSVAHVPSFIRTKIALIANGVDEIICISVNDPHVMRAWGEETGAAVAGITMLADAESKFTTEIGMNFDAPPAGLMARSVRYSMLVDDGVVTALNIEEARGVCDLSGGETMLEVVQAA